MSYEENTELAPIFGKTEIMGTDADALVRAMEETADEGGRMGDVSFMSFSGKRGVYKIGVDGREPGPEEPFVVAVPSFELGWMCWKGGKPVSKRMATIMQPKVPEPDPDEFGPFDERRGEGWFRARAITAKSLEASEQVYFSINSRSGVAALSDLQRDVLSRMKSGQPCWPVVVFDKEEFESQGYKNFKPVLDVVQWLYTEDVNKLADPDFEPMQLLDAPAEEKKDVKPEPNKRRRL